MSLISHAYSSLPLAFMNGGLEEDEAWSLLGTLDCAFVMFPERNRRQLTRAEWMHVIDVIEATIRQLQEAPEHA